VEVIELFKEKFLNVNGLRICYVEEGRGKPCTRETSVQGKNIIFIHGWQSSLKVWQYNLSYFTKQGYRVLALDLPGFGKSSKPKINYSIALFSRIIKKIIEKREMEKTSLVCYSMGTFVGIDLALKCPQKIESLVLVGAPGNFGTFLKRESLVKIIFSKPLLRFTTTFSFLTLKLYLIGKLLASNSKSQSRKIRELIRLRLSFLYQKSKYIHALHSSAMDIVNKNFGEEKKKLAKINLPTLIIRGEKEFLDLFASPRNCQYLLSNIKGASLVTLKNCGHYSMAEEPETFNKTVHNFLKAGK